MNESAVTASVVRGVYRRRIVLQTEDRRVFAALEDDFHHLYAAIVHDGRIATHVSGRTLRIPVSTCPDAVQRLNQFTGRTLTEGSGGLDARQQCTHLFDMVRLAMTHALRGGRRQYDIAVPYPVENKARAEIRRNGELALAWDIDGRHIVGPDAFAGSPLFGKVNWKNFDPDTYEAAILLRRGVGISSGRAITAAMRKAKTEGQIDGAISTPSPLKGACYSHQPEIFATGRKYDTNTVDFTDRPESLLAELAAYECSIPPGIIAEHSM